MRFPHFVGAVSRRAGIPPEQAAVIARAVLETMAERVTGGEADDLGAHLPDELSGYLVDPPARPDSGATAGGPAPGGAAFGPEEFLRRVGERAGVDPVTAGAGTGAVFATLREAVTVGEFRDLVAQLPTSFSGAIEPTPPAAYDN
ncbi:DUF2267 domain-containing protein [Micromonospora sp. ATA32]|nr:DUF2267 domain-containing protein [Micromonospora sp. ATA32]